MDDSMIRDIMRLYDQMSEDSKRAFRAYVPGPCGSGFFSVAYFYIRRTSNSYPTKQDNTTQM